MSSKVFKDYSQYYNLFYSDKNYAAECDYIHKKISEHSPKAKNILEYGSGTGGHGIILKNKGYNIFGVERSEEMASVARMKGYDCIVGDITSYRSEKAFDVCLALFHVVSYINSNEKLIEMFSNAKENLIEGGIFIFDVWFTSAVLSQRPELRVKKAENDQISVVRIARPVNDHLNNIVSVNYEVMVTQKKDLSTQQFEESHLMRHFSYPEIMLLAELTGFTVLKAEEFLTGKTPSAETWGVNFILKSK